MQIRQLQNEALALVNNWISKKNSEKVQQDSREGSVTKKPLGHYGLEGLFRSNSFLSLQPLSKEASNQQKNPILSGLITAHVYDHKQKEPPLVSIVQKTVIISRE